MKIHPVLALMLAVSASSFAQSKNEMPFSTVSQEASQLVRQAWVLYGDIKLDEGNDLVKQALDKDPEFAMAYLSLYTPDLGERKQNASKAGGLKLSADEKLFADGVKARLENQPTQSFFDPLLKKYPKDYFLGFLIMLNTETKSRIEIGEAMVKRNPKFAPAYNILGYAYMDQNNMPRAESNLNKYVSLRPELGNVYDSKGDYMMRTGNFKEAVPLYEKAASLGQKGASVRLQRATSRSMNPNISEQDKEEMKKVEAALAEAYLKGNVDAIVAQYADQGVEILQNHMSNVGAPNIRQRLTDQLKNGSFDRFVSVVETIDGLGPIAILRGKVEVAFKPTSGAATEAKRDYVHIFHKQRDGAWRILTASFSEAVQGESADEGANVRKVISGFNIFKPGEELFEKSIELFLSNYSPQAVEVFPNQRSNIGKANISARLSGFIGTKWESNSVGTLGVSVSGRKAAAWGVWVQNYYPKDSDKLIKYQFPWVMILTKENDNAWRLLALHWYNE